MDPVPDGMFRFTLVVEEDPSQARAIINTSRFWTSNWNDPVGYILPFQLASIGGINTFPDYYHDFWPDGTFLLKIHPDDRDKLSQPFSISIRDFGKAHLRNKTVLVFPRGRQENRYEVLTAGSPREEDYIPETDKRVLLPPPFEEEFDAIAKEKTREHGVKGGLFLVGGAFLLDVVCLPAEALYWIGREIYRRF